MRPPQKLGLDFSSSAHPAFFFISHEELGEIGKCCFSTKLRSLFKNVIILWMSPLSSLNAESTFSGVVLPQERRFFIFDCYLVLNQHLGTKGKMKTIPILFIRRERMLQMNLLPFVSSREDKTPQSARA